MKDHEQLLYNHRGEKILSRTASLISKIRREPSAQLQEEYKDLELDPTKGEQFAEEVEAPIHLEKDAYLIKEAELEESSSSTFKEEVKFDSTWYSVDNVCSSFPDPTSKEQCRSVLDDASIRVREAEIDGVTVYEWTVKLKETNIDGVRSRPEIEGYTPNNAESHIRLMNAINEQFRIKGFDIEAKTNDVMSVVDLRVVKTRRTYEFKPPDVKEGAKCFGTKIDMDVITMVNGTKLTKDKIIYSLDVEGPNKEQIEHCARCLGLTINPDFDLYALFVEKGLAERR